MRFFTDTNGNFNWAAVAGLCAVVGALVGVATYFGTSRPDAAQVNQHTVLNETISGDKIEGITLEEYEAGLKRREEEVIKRLSRSDNLTSDEVRSLQETLEKIEARQADLTTAYKDARTLTAEIRSLNERIQNPKLFETAIATLFNGDTSGAVRNLNDAGLQIKNLGTIEKLSTVFQPVETEVDFLKFVAGRDLEDNNSYVIHISRNGALKGSFQGSGFIDNLRGSWEFDGGKYCREYQFNNEHRPLKCLDVFTSNTAVKFVHSNGDTSIWAKK